MIVKIVKIYLGLSLVLLWVLWGQFIFRQFLGPADISQDLQAPSHVVSTNDRVLIYCTCHFQGGSFCFSFFCLLTCSVALWGGRDGHCKQITLACACSASATLGLPPAHGPHFSGSRLLHEEPSEAGPGLHAPPRSEPLRFRHSGSLQRCRLGWACILCPSQVRADQVIRCLVSTVAVTYHLPATWFSGCTFSGRC